MSSPVNVIERQAPAASVTPYQALLTGWSIEVTSREPKTIDSCPERLDRGTNVYLTWIPGDDPAKTVAAATVLRRGGLVPVPHIGARHLESVKQFDDLMARFAGEAGVDTVLAIAGEREKPAGPYSATQQVLESGILQKHGVRNVGVGGFPEGNPNVPDPVQLEAALAAKLAWGRSAGVQMHLATQFCFEAEPIIIWLRKIRRSGIDVPVRVGLAGPASIATLTRYAIRCGVGNSLKALTRGPSLSRLLTDSSPEQVIRELAEAAAKDPSLGIAGLHFFVFGGFNKTADWTKAQREAG